MKQFLEDPSLGLVRSERPAQLTMYDTVLDTIENGGIAAVQAGTGTGKSYAYLIALLDAIKRGVISRAVVATAKKTLQSQLQRKDLPAIANKVGDFDYATLKGKANYVCRLRYEEFVEREPWSQFPGFDFAAFAKWVGDDPIGDFSASDHDVPFQWQVRVTECIREHCPHLGACGYARNRLDAKDAEILIVNHSLLALDFQLGRGKVLGEYDAVVVDEAHQLAEFATKAYSFELYHQQAEQLERGLQNDYRIKFPEELKAAYDNLFKTLARVDSGELPKTPAVEGALVTVANGLVELKARLQKNGITVESIATAEDLLGERKPAPEQSDVNGARRKGKLTAVATVVEKALKAIEVIMGDRDDYLSLVERRDFRDLPRITVTPLDVGPMVAPALKACGKVVLTSATLKTTDGYGYLCRGLGLSSRDLTKQVDLPSPFDFQKRSGLWVSPTALMPTGATKADAVKQQIKEIDELLVASGGGAFVLCASREDMRTIGGELILKKRKEYNVLTQSDNVDKDIAAFASGYNNVLVGVKSIWEGVDVPGMKLRMVIIPRLPFPNKGDFLHNAKKDLVKARMVANGSNPTGADMQLFNDFDVQMVAMDLAQGAGRLIRTENDFGLLVILDPRMHPGSKGYSNALRRLLPHPPYTEQAKMMRLVEIFRNLSEKERAARGG